MRQSNEKLEKSKWGRSINVFGINLYSVSTFYVWCICELLIEADANASHIYRQHGACWIFIVHYQRPRWMHIGPPPSYPPPPSPHTHTHTNALHAKYCRSVVDVHICNGSPVWCTRSAPIAPPFLINCIQKLNNCRFNFKVCEMILLLQNNEWSILFIITNYT